MLEKIRINIIQVGRHLVAAHPFLVKEFIPERSPICVTNVATLLSLAPPFAIIREFTLERNLLNAVNVGEPSVRVHHSFNMKESTLEKSPIDVMNVERASLLFPDSIDIE
jgi:hypothetical protein